MKRNGIINSEIASVLARMGHTDTLCIGDCGLPIPDGTKRIDLALTLGTPAFLDVLKAVLDDMKVEKIVLAEEMKTRNPQQLEAVRQLFATYGEPLPEVVFVSHEELKRQTGSCKAVVRTGETTPYSNIILQSGCIF
jgi:D-ribose pyranase